MKYIIALGFIAILLLPCVSADHDLSTQKYFPPIGNQGSSPSCTSWALTYYDYTYMYAKAHNWNASNGNPAYIFSPAFTFNRQKYYDYESTADVIIKSGVCTLNYMPYVANDRTSLGNESAVANALTHMDLVSYTHLTYNSSEIGNIKLLIDNDIPVVMAISTGNMMDYPYGANVNNCIMGEYYNTSRLVNHAVCIVGYNATAFKVANSYGSGYGISGYFYVTFNAFNKIGQDSDAMYLILHEQPQIIPIGLNQSFPIMYPEDNFTSDLPLDLKQDARSTIGLLLIGSLFVVFVAYIVIGRWKK